MLKKIILLNISLIIFLSSCNIFSESESEDLGLSYSINIAESRTIVPSFSGEIGYYTIQGSDETETNTISQTISSSSGTINNITEGTWTFIVTAYDSSDNKLASGSGTTVISWRKVNSISIPLDYIQYYTQDSTGDLSITVNWPDNLDTQIVYVIWPDGNGDEINVSSLSSYTFSKQDITSGSTNELFLEFFNSDSDTIFTVTETVHIYDDKTTSKVITLTDNNFLIPTNPSNVVASNYTLSAGYSDSLDISWDSSSTADYYQVYFSYEPTETVWSTDTTPVDITSVFTTENEPYYRQSYINSQTIEINAPESGETINIGVTVYTIDNSTNMNITVRVVSVNNYGESSGTTTTYTTP